MTKAKTFQKVKAIVDKKTAKAHLDRFMTDAEQWRSMFDTDYLWTKAEREVARSFAALRIFKVVQPAPRLLSLVRAYRDKKIKYKALRNALAMIEKFHFSFNAVTSSRSSGGISGMYSSFGRQVFHAKDGEEIGNAIRELLAKLRYREVPTSEFDAGFEQIIYTKAHSSQKTLVQYILKRLAAIEGQLFRGETEDLTIEHLLPQSSSNDDEDEKLIGQLGNLILVDAETNNMLSTNDFKAKKQILMERGYNLPEILVNSEELTPDVIKENTLRISILARSDIWKV